jgi:hypothetical protein
MDRGKYSAAETPPLCKQIDDCCYPEKRRQDHEARYFPCSIECEKQLWKASCFLTEIHRRLFELGTKF